MTIGAISLPNNSPNLIHVLLSGVRSFELKIPNIRKIKEKMINTCLGFPWLTKGHKPINKNTTKNKIPKLLLLLIIIRLNIIKIDLYQFETPVFVFNKNKYLYLLKILLIPAPKTPKVIAKSIADAL